MAPGWDRFQPVDQAWGVSPANGAQKSRHVARRFPVQTVLSDIAVRRSEFFLKIVTEVNDSESQEERPICRIGLQGVLRGEVWSCREPTLLVAAGFHSGALLHRPCDQNWRLPLPAPRVRRAIPQGLPDALRNAAGNVTRCCLDRSSPVVSLATSAARHY